MQSSNQEVDDWMKGKVKKRDRSTDGDQVYSVQIEGTDGPQRVSAYSGEDIKRGVDEV